MFAAAAFVTCRRCALVGILSAVVYGPAISAAPTAALAPTLGEPARATLAPNINVIPLPAQVAPGTGSFAIRTGTGVVLPHDPRAARVALYFVDLMQTTRGIRLATAAAAGASATSPAAAASARATATSRGAAPAAESTAAAVRAVPTAGSIVFKLRASTLVPKAPDGASSTALNPEAYTLDVSPDGVVLSASDPRGLLYAAVTLWQLTTSGEVSGTVTVPAVKIVDSPRFAWRGLMLDSARHYQSPEFILHFIDWMALHKLNVLHWHLTDDQAWRLEIKKYPRLTSVGAWRVPAGAAPAADIDPATGRPRLYGGFYSQETVRKIVAHALERNVTIVPEIDMPGHATAAVVAYPRLASVAPAPAVVPSDWGVYSNLYNPDESTFKFLEDVLSEVVQLFPGTFVHIGGDEAVKDQWKASSHIQERMRELGVSNEEALQRYFVERVGKFLTAHHRRLIGWDEILEGGIPHDATIMSWRGVEGAYAAAAAGHDAVLSPSPTLYFDNRQAAFDTQPGRGHVVSLEDVYKFDPMPPSLAPDSRKHILGLQANIWTEHIRTEERVEYMTFPRAAAVAEVSWSAADRLNWGDFLSRLPQQMWRYEMVGIQPSQDAFGDRVLHHVISEVRSLSSHELKSCTDKVVLSLEDDAPVDGQRAAFLVDIMNPCWIYPAVDLSNTQRVVAAVGQVPFNFQLGADVHGIKLNPPQTPSGELEVRLDGCDGERIALLPLQPAIANDDVTMLPAATLAHHDGTHDLCLKFTQRSLDPMWVLDWVRLE
ncbi:MAG TPA: family 20 glycosylhydrolase [Steroidobacteraceae bacterium]|nr:family 20 glycosylhydrolase [Steroidobacteraceae bacterium]